MTAPAARTLDPIAAYRDDGPLARALGRALGGSIPLPAPAVALAGLVPLVAALAIGGGDVSRPAAAAVLAWALLCGGASSGAGSPARIAWAGPPLTRAIDYLALIWIAALHGASSYPGAYALIAALTFRHYDLVYRLRHRALVAARWVSLLAGGWDGRLVVAFALLALGALPAGYYVLAGVLGAAFAAEAVHGWAVAGRGEGEPEPEGDEEDAEL
jgi:hypothetical protein